MTSVVRRIGVVAATLVLGAVVSAQAQDQATFRERLDKMIHDTTLANGLEVIVAQSHAVPIATVEVVVRTGAFTQEPGDEGVAHLFEHVLFRAYGDEGRWNGEVARLDGMSNGTTTTENVTYYITIPSENVEKATRLMAGLVTDPKFRTSDLEEELRIVIGEYERNASDPQFALRDASERLLWGNAMGRKDPLGVPSILSKVPVARLRELYARYYVPNNSAVIVTGDVRPAEVFAWVAQRFGKWKPAADPFKVRPLTQMDTLTRPGAQVVGGDVPQVSVSIQWQGPSVGSAPKDTYAADVFSDMLNAPNSTFHQDLVSSGLFQSIGITYYTQNWTGPIGIFGITTPDRAEEAFAALRREISRFDDPGYVSAEQLAIAKKRRAVQTEFGLERGSGLAHSLAFWWAVAGLAYYRGYVDSMLEITAADVDAYVRRYITGRPYAASAMAPSRSQAAVNAAFLKHFGSEVIK